MCHALLYAAAATAAVHTGAGSGTAPVLHHHYARPAQAAVVAHAPDRDGDADDMVYRRAPAPQSPAPVRTAAPVSPTPAVQTAADPPPRPAPVVRAAPVAQTAPRPAPAVTTTAGAGGSTQQIIQSAFGPLGPGAVAWGTRVAACESGGSASAQNASGATGLFQFMPSTFASTPQGQSGASITDPTASAQAAAWMYSQGRTSG